MNTNNSGKFPTKKYTDVETLYDNNQKLKENLNKIKKDLIMVKSDNFKQKEELYKKERLLDEVLDSNEIKSKINVEIVYPKLKEVIFKSKLLNL